MFNKLKTMADPDVMVHSITRAIGTFWGHQNYKKFIIVARARTGSNMLIDLLNQQSSIVAQGELFATLQGRTVDAILGDTYGHYPHWVKAVGFKIFYYHPLDDDSGLVWQRFQEMDDLCVIHLRRRNILRAFLSSKIATKTDDWRRRFSAGNQPLQQRRVVLSEDELRQQFQITRDWEDNFGLAFASKQVVEVTYEGLVEAPEKELEPISEALGLRITHYRSRLKRQNPEPLSELITNYQELKTCFRGTEWSIFFED